MFSSIGPPICSLMKVISSSRTRPYDFMTSSSLLDVIKCSNISTEAVSCCEKYLNVTLQSSCTFPVVTQLSPNPGRAPEHGNVKAQHLGRFLFILYLHNRKTPCLQSPETSSSTENTYLYIFNKQQWLLQCKKNQKQTNKNTNQVCSAVKLTSLLSWFS